ncbi:MAG: glycosyl transferase, partial [Microbacteriaceae bacterium]|nr:glycosyl transferase [Microbacteriaceae bacterium]
MRFIVSVILFGVAAVMVGVGILIHAVFSPPETISQSITIADPAPITVIDSTSLNEISSTQTISVIGGAEGT